MKALFFLIVTLSSVFVFANETVQIAAGFNIYKCSAFCGTPISKVSPVVIELASSGSDSQVLMGRTELLETRDGINFSAIIQVVKVPSGPDKGYLIQAFLLASKDDKQISFKQNGLVLVENLSKVNRIDWEDKVNDGDVSYVPIISIGPVN